jgi:GNAT superfamily N-acetyltransferase
LRDAFEGYRPLYTPEAFAATTPSADQIRQRWDEGPVWIALQDGHPVGTVAAAPRGAALYMRSMAVLPASRGSGCGGLLLAAVEAFAASHGHHRLVLSTTPFLHPAIRLYERAGFMRSGAAPHDLAGTPLFTMEKELATGS